MDKDSGDRHYEGAHEGVQDLRRMGRPLKIERAVKHSPKGGSTSCVEQKSGSSVRRMTSYPPETGSQYKKRSNKNRKPGVVIVMIVHQTHEGELKTRLT